MIAQPPHITQLLLDLRRPKQLKGCLRLFELAASNGVAILTGGVRGWAETLGCGLSYPKILFAELESLEIIAGIEYFPGEGGQVAHIYLQQDDSITDQHDEEPPLLALEVGAHSDAAAAAPDRSLIVPPCTPHVDDHDSLQQQQHAREDAIADSVQPSTVLTRLLRTEFPGSDAALLAAWAANPQVNDCKAARDALAGYPKATLADWMTDLAAAEERPNSSWPVGLVLACWSWGERVTPRRALRSAPPARERRNANAAPPAPAAPTQRRPDDREIREDVELSQAERAAFLAHYAAAADDETRAEVLCTFRRALAEQLTQSFIQQAAPTVVGVAAGMPGLPGTLQQIWQAAMHPVQQRLNRQEFDTWLRGTSLLALESGQATLLAQSAFHKEGLENRHLTLIRSSISDVIGMPVQVRVVIAGAQ